MSNAEQIAELVERCETAPSLNDGEQLLSYLNQLYQNAQNPTVSQSGAVKMCLSSIVPHIEKAINERLKAHTNATLQELKEKVERLKTHAQCTTPEGFEERRKALNEVIALIEDLKDE